jgi:hypothetical protein
MKFSAISAYFIETFAHISFAMQQYSYVCEIPGADA